MARCLVGRPKLILLDEPTEGIQPSIIDEMVETLQRLRAQGGLTMILVEQNLEFIAALSERVLIIQKGVIVRSTKPDELHDHGLIHEFIGVDESNADRRRRRKTPSLACRTRIRRKEERAP